MKSAILILISICSLIAQFNVNKIFNDFKSLQNRDIQNDTSLLTINHISIGSLEKNQNKYYGLFQFKFNIIFNDNFSVIFNPLITKNRNYYIPKTASKNYYQYKTYIGLTSYTEEGYLQYKSTYFFLKLGRFIDKIGYSPIEQLYLNDRDYHDGYYIRGNYKNFIFENRFYQLSPLINDVNTNRYFFHHSLKWQINTGFEIGIHESTIQSGTNSTPRINLLNPFSIYHAEQVNDNINLNTIYFFQVKYSPDESLYTWMDFLLDDYQSDSESESIGNKEPTEFATQIGLRYNLDESNTFTTQISLVRNRTFNDPISKAKKFIDHDKYMGFYLGSNLINFDFSYSNKITDDMYFMYRLKNTIFGTESIFNNFNTDYLTTEPYSEPIPYGKLITELEQSIFFNSTLFDVNYYSELNIKHIDKIPHIKFNVGINYKFELY